MSIESARYFMTRSGRFGSLALPGCGQTRRSAKGFVIQTAGPQAAHFEPHARASSDLPSSGASHIDTFDPKPVLTRLDGQSGAGSFNSRKPESSIIKARSEAHELTIRYKRYGTPAESRICSRIWQRAMTWHYPPLPRIVCHGPPLNLLL